MKNWKRNQPPAEIIKINVVVRIDQEEFKSILVENYAGQTTWLPRKRIVSKEPIEGKPNKFRIGVEDWLFNKLEWSNG